MTNAVAPQPLDGGRSPQVDSNGDPVLTGRTETYTYDALNRLSTVGYGDGESHLERPIGFQVYFCYSIPVWRLRDD